MTTYMKTKEAAAYARVSPGKIRDWVKNEGLPAVRNGKDFIFNVEDIDRLMSKLKTGGRE
ncbi:helix-turn-helix domain-containing protein [Treponema saccharophilum]|uniref:helix-turn-helix domain-containing protein n=1 Tax=Treponema saccharophilum TaxID=165 RepID=UPI003870D2DA